MLNTKTETQLELFTDEPLFIEDSKDYLSHLSPSELSQKMALNESNNIFKIIENFSNTLDMLEKSYLEQNLRKILFDKTLESQRWSDFKTSYNFKLVGWSGIDEDSKAKKGFSHIHIEAWTCHPEKTSFEHETINNKVLTTFADNATYCKHIQPQYFKKK